MGSHSRSSSNEPIHCRLMSRQSVLSYRRPRPHCDIDRAVKLARLHTPAWCYPEELLLLLLLEWIYWPGCQTQEQHRVSGLQPRTWHYERNGLYYKKLEFPFLVPPQLTHENNGSLVFALLHSVALHSNESPRIWWASFMNRMHLFFVMCADHGSITLREARRLLSRQSKRLSAPRQNIERSKSRSRIRRREEWMCFFFLFLKTTSLTKQNVLLGEDDEGGNTCMLARSSSKVVAARCQGYIWCQHARGVAIAFGMTARAEVWLNLIVPSCRLVTRDRLPGDGYSQFMAT